MDSDVRGRSDLLTVTIQRGTDRPVRLDLACGQSPREGLEGVDLNTPGCRTVNLIRFRWPWECRSVDEIYSSHFVEHNPTIYVTLDGSTSPLPRPAEEKDLFFAFFDERWRILEFGGVMTVINAVLRSNCGFQKFWHSFSGNSGLLRRGETGAPAEELAVTPLSPFSW